MRAVVQVLSFDLMAKVILGVLGIVLIRYMPAEEYADYVFGLALTAFVAQSVAATFNRVHVLSASAAPNGRHEWSLLGLQATIVGVLAVLGLPLVADLGAAYFLVVLLVLASCLSDFAKTCCQRDLQFFRFSMIELARALLFFGGAATLIAIGTGAVSAPSVIAIQTVSLLVVAWVALHRRSATWQATGPAAMARYGRELLRGDYAFLFAYFFVLGVFTQTDIFMLKIVGDADMLATYGSAFRYYSILSLALGAVHAVLLPTIQKLSTQAELRAVLAMHRRVLALFGVVALVAGWLAEWAIPWVDAGKYPDAVLSFRILCVSAVVSFAFSPYVNLLMRFEQFGFLLGLILAALALHVALSGALIPGFGAAGAATATLVSAAVVTFSIFLKSRGLAIAAPAPDEPATP
ncbi:MAG: hypothetical protein CVU18_12065 [Betaproteobacteria bacterium HGW-Betaproteobacteria-12]|nr:MAG: hypothetical protein CVU18_12065 [Betaproteobacteria bacterium HGW-Betaproteobacteria-12]